MGEEGHSRSGQGVNKTHEGNERGVLGDSLGFLWRFGWFREASGGRPVG